VCIYQTNRTLWYVFGAVVRCDCGFHYNLLMGFTPVCPGSSPSSTPLGKSPVVWTRANQAEATFYSIRPFLLPVKIIFWKFKSAEDPWLTILRIPCSILHITTWTNTTKYYVFYYYIILYQYYVILHLTILRITTVCNTAYYSINTTYYYTSQYCVLLLSLILHITTSILHQYFGQYYILLQYQILHNTTSILHQYYVPILHITT